MGERIAKSGWRAFVHAIPDWTSSTNDSTRRIWPWNRSTQSHSQPEYCRLVQKLYWLKEYYTRLVARINVNRVNGDINSSIFNLTSMFLSEILIYRLQLNVSCLRHCCLKCYCCFLRNTHFCLKSDNYFSFSGYLSKDFRTIRLHGDSSTNVVESPLAKCLAMSISLLVKWPFC